MKNHVSGRTRTIVFGSEHRLGLPVLRVASSVALLFACACGHTSVTEPGTSNAFTGTWEGVKRLVSCSPAGPRCDSHLLGVETYFRARLDQQGDAVEGSVDLSEGGPLALPYGFFIRGQISTARQLTFERYFTFDAGEPPYSGDITIKTTLGRQLMGRMTKEPSASDSMTLVYDILANRR